MKKFNIVVIVLVIITTFFIFNKVKIDDIRFKLIKNDNFTRGIFISYIEFENFDNKSEKEIKNEIDKMIKKIKKNNLNTIYLHVKPFSDSIYNSNILPTSRYIGSYEGDKLVFDILDYFIEKSHENNIKLYAWINPYRISNQTDTTIISSNNPAYKWLNTNNVSVIEGKGIYYNPASNDVLNLLKNIVSELVNNYKIDGLILDDYFYPDKKIDLDNYNKSDRSLTIDNYRLDVINRMVRELYKIVKKKDKNILFGISPQGNINNNYIECYADVKTWLSNDGYIDFIMPQIYFGFNNQYQPFINNLNSWISLVKNDVKVIPALSLYKNGKIDEYAGSGINEWIENDNIIDNQIKIIKDKKLSGYSLFSYKDL